MEVLSKPKQTVVATRKTRRADRSGGWRGQIGGWNAGQLPKDEAPQNPNLKEVSDYDLMSLFSDISSMLSLLRLQKIVKKYNIDIDPASLVSRIVSVREQIAEECKRDCETMISANDQILASYFETQENSRLDREETDPLEHDEDEAMNSLTIPYSEAQKHSKHHDKSAFDRYNAMLLLSNSMDFNMHSSSPLRKGTFDLLLLLSTQESVHRVLKDYATAGDEREVSFAWLRDYYMDRVGEYFDGHQRYGRADDFLEDLLTTPPMLKSLDDNDQRKEVMGLIDPLRMAEDIIRRRSEVGREWQEILASVQHDHMALRRELLGRQMGEQVEIVIPANPLSAFEASEGFE